MNQKWAIFDDDNTLWHIEELYNEARDEFCSLMSLSGADAGEVEKYQRIRDIELYKYYGYSSCRFPRSFEDTVIHFMGIDNVDLISTCRDIASKVFYADPKWNDQTEVVLAALKKTHRLALITAGEEWVQKRKIDLFQHIGLFDSINFVEKKSSQILDDFCRVHHVDKANSWMIGDSLRSDIEPAASIGLNAIWYESENWAIEGRDMDFNSISSGSKIIKIDKLSDVLHCLGL